MKLRVFLYRVSPIPILKVGYGTAFMNNGSSRLIGIGKGRRTSLQDGGARVYSGVGVDSAMD